MYVLKEKLYDGDNLLLLLLLLDQECDDLLISKSNYLLTNVYLLLYGPNNYRHGGTWTCMVDAITLREQSTEGARIKSRTYKLTP